MRGSRVLEVLDPSVHRSHPIENTDRLNLGTSASSTTTFDTAIAAARLVHQEEGERACMPSDWR
eukprot:2360402-Alexandrium_andersonii.AAC.1